MTVSVRTPVRYSHCVGFFAEVGRGFSNPYDVAPGPDDLLYVVNRSNGADAPLGGMRVTICKADSEYLGEWSQYGDGPGQLVWPTAIVLDGHNRLWIADEHRHDVQCFETDGRYVSSVGGYGSEPGQLNRPAGLALDRDGNLIVTDTHNNRIQKLSPDGECLASWGSAGNGPGQFNLPWGVTVDRRGHVYVADWRNDRIQKLSPDGQHIATFGEPGTGDGQLTRPSGVDVDGDGNVYVADWGNDRVQMFGPDGGHRVTLLGDSGLSAWAEEGMKGNLDLVLERDGLDLTPEKRFWGPTSVKVDARGHVVVSDSCRHRLQVYVRNE